MNREHSIGIADGPPPIIETKELTKQFGSFKAVKEVTFAVPEGINFGMLGPNGAGKSTLIRMLTTLLPISAGSATVCGIDLRSRPSEVRFAIGVVPQATTSDPDLTAEENLLFYAGLYGVPLSRRKRLSEELLRPVDLYEWRHKKTGTFSGGMRRRLEVARSLVHQPKVLFLDEPTTGLDPASRIAMWEMVRNVKERCGLTLFLTTHYMDEADQLCDTIAIFDHGQIIAKGTPAELKAALPGIRQVEASFLNAPPSWHEVLERLPGFVRIEKQGDFYILESDRVQQAMEEILIATRTHGVTIGSMTMKGKSMDDVFIHFTGRALRDSVANTTKMDVSHLYQGAR